ncbi:hypothetical protein J4E86_001090 [Alternaria arbusti]|uniref:uncharacterized protein n=1 Tax=Alternaria arbusti TaxID=232088 RepID=UPI00221EA5C8|nr:uncharacterized protein J4E86_001090 [Alternaria arbusti]KAI4962058.1 hypothetical protein J4E86_001090 [Alternaria arbusti]
MISVRLHVTSLVDAPPYTAVSYVWGEPSPTKQILLNGQPFTVRQNLWDLLSRLQEVKYDDYLWIDALSIDQASDSEKTHQVAIMGSIYTRAKKTIAWLGTASMEVEEQVHALKTELTVQELPYLRQRPANKDDPHVAGLRYILGHPYWTRTWIFQEYLLSSSVGFWCGNEILSDLELKSRADKLLSVKDPIETNAQAKAFYLIQIGSRSGVTDFSLEWLMDVSSESACVDPRDRIYALLSLMSPQEQELWDITPDYAASNQDLFEHLCSVFQCSVLQDTDEDVQRKVRRQEQWKEELRYILLLDPVDEDGQDKTYVSVEEDRQDKTYVSDVVETRPRDHRASRLREK